MQFKYSSSGEFASKLNLWFGFYCFAVGLACEVYLNYVDLFGIAPSNYFFLFSLLTLRPSDLPMLRKNSFLVGFLFVMAGSTFIFILSDLINVRDSDWVYIVKILMKFPLAFGLTVYFSQKVGTTKVLKTYLAIVLPNCFLSIMQFMGASFPWEIRQRFDPPSYLELINKGRPSGLSYYVIEFAHQTLLAFSAAVLLFKREQKGVYLFAAILTGCAISISQTRSHILGALIFVALTFFLTKGNRKSLAVLALSLVSFIAIQPELTTYFSGNKNLERDRLLRDDTSFYSRIYLAYGAIMVFRDHPVLGLGSDIHNYNKIVSKVDIPDIAGISGKESVSFQFPHNAFLNYLVTYGLCGLLLLVLFLLYLSRNLIIIGTPEGRLLLAALATFLFTALFHNGATWNTSAGIVLMAICCGELGYLSLNNKVKVADS